MTLVNLIGFAQRKILPPQPDFARTCPFLGDRGYLLPVEGRPYNCVTFICDTIEAVLPDVDKDRFYELDSLLRKLYQGFPMRYLGAEMTGLLLQEQRLSGRAFFTLK
ncbi:MAG: hypothetical protein OQK50_04215 [Deltaproteobacteria bacterium]|jgi:hypothetical protein|nr:hypothetical protein [Deltaproteobacteria bacterium]